MSLKELHEEKKQNELNELMEKYIPKRVTVRQFVELIADDKDCYITRGGKATYYYGSIKDIPECLLDLELIEFSPKFERRDDGLGLSWYIVLFVYPNTILDLLSLEFTNWHTMPKGVYDATYKATINQKDPELSILREIDKVKTGSKNIFVPIPDEELIVEDGEKMREER